MTTLMTMSTNIPPLKVLQWNARGLNKNKLEEFKRFLSYFVPLVVLLSETHWNEKVNVKFRCYNVIKKNRPNGKGGGVAILIHKSLKFIPIQLRYFETMEAVAVSISTFQYNNLEFISVYAPRGDSTKEEILSLFTRNQPFIVGGDFNAHHELWESRPYPNRGGTSIWNALIELPDISLLTPKDLCTRFDPATNKPSTIDLSFASAMIAINAVLKTGHSMGSDHLPIMMTFDEQVNPQISRPQNWIFNDSK